MSMGRGSQTGANVSGDAGQLPSVKIKTTRHYANGSEYAGSYHDVKHPDDAVAELAFAIDSLQSSPEIVDSVTLEIVRQV